MQCTKGQEKGFKEEGRGLWSQAGLGGWTGSDRREQLPLPSMPVAQGDPGCSHCPISTCWKLSHALWHQEETPLGAGPQGAGPKLSAEAGLWAPESDPGDPGTEAQLSLDSGSLTWRRSLPHSGPVAKAHVHTLGSEGRASRSAALSRGRAGRGLSSSPAPAVLPRPLAAFPSLRRRCSGPTAPSGSLPLSASSVSFSLCAASPKPKERLWSKSQRISRGDDGPFPGAAALPRGLLGL